MDFKRDHLESIFLDELRQLYNDYENNILDLA
jgi:hypothetical protein